MWINMYQMSSYNGGKRFRSRAKWFIWLAAAAIFYTKS